MFTKRGYQKFLTMSMLLNGVGLIGFVTMTLLTNQISSLAWLVSPHAVMNLLCFALIGPLTNEPQK